MVDNGGSSGAVGEKVRIKGRFINKYGLCGVPQFISLAEVGVFLPQRIPCLTHDLKELSAKFIILHVIFKFLVADLAVAVQVGRFLEVFGELRRETI